MEIDDSDKRYLIIIAGILVFTVLSIFMIISLGVGGKLLYNQRDFMPVNLESQSNIDFNTENEDSGSKKLGPIAHRGWVDCLDTEQGYIKIIDYYIDDPLPLHLSREDIDDWYVILEVRGGYEPVEGWIDVYQGKEGYQGRILLEWTYLGLEPSWYEYWQINFVPEGDIFLDSNQYPEIDHDWFYIDCEGEIPGKHVEFDVYTRWTGCGEPDQDFEVILVQTFVSRISNS
jgi:hypothetical protein